MLRFRRDDPRRFVELQDILGMGSFGTVYRGQILGRSIMFSFHTLWISLLNKAFISLDPKSAYKEVAVKVIDYTVEELHSLGRELYFLKKLNSPYIIHYVESFLTGEELWILMELCDGGSLLDLYQATQKTLDEDSIKAVVACRL